MGLPPLRGTVLGVGELGLLKTNYSQIGPKSADTLQGKKRVTEGELKSERTIEMGDESSTTKG